MPWQQYQASEMTKNNSVLLKNNYNVPINIYYVNTFSSTSNTNLFTYNAQANNIPPFRGNGYFANPAYSNPASQPTFTFTYPNMTDSTDYTIRHYVYRSGANNDFITANDTVYQYQRFRNYYALDDGGAEAGYYVLGAGGQMAVRFTVNTTDTLRAVRIYFDPAPLASTSKYYFKLRLYSGSTGPTNDVFTSDTLHPKFYNKSFKHLPEYALKTPLVLTPGTYYIGIQQQLSTGLVVGFDRNTPGKNNLYYNSGTGWNVSGFKGALMIRPVFGKKIPSPVGIRELETILANINVYPNPASDLVYISNQSEFAVRYELRNALGQLVLSDVCQSSQHEISTSNLPSGIYFLTLLNGDRSLRQQKLIIAH
jgi:hypothetical protein